MYMCPRKTTNRFTTTAWLASHYTDQLRVRKGWDVNEFINQVKKDHVLEISIQKAYVTRNIALKMLAGSYSEQFGALWDYAEEIRLTNLGTTVKIKPHLDTNGIPVFERIYICYAANKDGFKAG